MKKRHIGNGLASIHVLLVLLAFAFAIPAMAKASTETVTLGMLDQDLEQFEGSDIDAFAHDENEIEFQQPGIAKYDTFFEETAVVSGILQELKFVLAGLDSGDLSVADAMPVIQFGTLTLPDLQDRIPSLVNQAQGFQPSQDFTGMRNKMKVPAVTSGLVSAGKSLKNSAEELPNLLRQVQAVASKAAP